MKGEKYVIEKKKKTVKEGRKDARTRIKGDEAKVEVVVGRLLGLTYYYIRRDATTGVSANASVYQ